MAPPMRLPTPPIKAPPSTESPPVAAANGAPAEAPDATPDMN